jgi:predicted ribosome quality control (RQC) complex YloA/Tae2 family protein
MVETAAPARPAEHLDRGAGCEEDFVLWTERQAALIRARQLDLVDWDHVAEEIEAMGSRERRELSTRLKVLMMHLLKWQFQLQKRSRSWRATINDQRDEIEQLLHDNPSLRREVEALIRERYRTARANAAGETGLAPRTFPSRCPYPAEQVLDSTYFPEATEDE